MESLGSIIKETKDAIFERIKNPFLGSLFFFWLIWNWKYWGYIVFGSNTFEFRIEKSPAYMNWWFLTVLPLVLAIGYTLGSSYVFNWIESKSKSGIEERRRNYYERLKIDYTQRKEAAQEKYNLKKIEEGITQLDDLSASNEELRNELKFERELAAKNKTVLDEKNANIDHLKKTINLDFQFDLVDENIDRIIRDNSDEAITNLGNYISKLYGKLHKELESVDRNHLAMLEKIGAGMFEMIDNKLVSIELFPTGRYLLRRFLFSRDEFLNININYSNRLDLINKEI
ncbi:hypothetical protein SYJ56_07990 [Algoriphagus sp. D3-2-R+10]|uniref:hypothetical protein n=1 Tax=Algoriphagus aurantiacus TaxID=3103948 RepID=UPI002B3B22C6|nr:hypothetical protein [Algoriphagus sp. D3-2-R+10]MEB2775245.1 hypothetical protein [Algoriphagus sp. D3-2-R+10]